MKNHSKINNFSKKKISFCAKKISAVPPPPEKIPNSGAKSIKKYKSSFHLYFLLKNYGNKMFKSIKV